MGNDDQPPEESREDKAGESDTKETLTSPRSGRTIKKMRNEADTGLLMPPSPPTFVTMQQLTEASNAFYNMSLAHEITVDAHFKLQMYEPPEQSLEHCVKETMHRAFWDILRASLEADPPDFQPALRLLGEVKQSLSGLILPNQKTLEKLLEDALDLEAAREQLEATGQISLETYAGQVIGIMKRFCAPVRDREVAALEAITDPVEAFQQAFVLLEKMHMDLANFTIMQMRPYIRQQAADYERTQFATFLEAQQKIGIDGLARTRQWIQDAYQRIISDQHREPSTSEAPQDIPATTPALSQSQTSHSNEVVPATPSNILLEAYLSLLAWPADKDWPETMLMDQQRLIEIGLQLSKIVTLTSLVLVVCNCVVHKASQLFPTPVRHSLQTQVLLDLKRCVFQGACRLLDSTSLANLPEKAETVADPLLSVVDRWYNSTRTVCQTPTSSNLKTSEADGPTTSPSKLPIAIPQPVHQEIRKQVISIFESKHPVHCLMQQRAMKFLRSAMSSRPPESLSLPPGFSILTEMMTTSRGTNGHPEGSPSPSLPSTMASGIRRVPRPGSEEDPNQERKDSAHVSLSLIDLAGRLMPLLAHNRHVFGARYAEIIQAILLPNLESSGADAQAGESQNTSADGGQRQEQEEFSLDVSA